MEMVIAHFEGGPLHGKMFPLPALLDRYWLPVRFGSPSMFGKPAEVRTIEYLLGRTRCGYAKCPGHPVWDGHATYRSGFG